VITFWVSRDDAAGFAHYLETRGAEIRDRFTVRCYDWKGMASGQLPPVAGGAQIFAAVDRLNEPEREAAAQLYRQVSAVQPAVPMLNDPASCLLRPRLLDRLAREGINAFRCYPAEAAERVGRFPVFVRESFGHSGALTPLLDSAAALRSALRTLRLRGYRRRELLIVEFLDTSRDGRFRKYSAFRVGDAIVPAHIMVGREWVMKAESNERTLASAEEELAFVEDNPHEHWLRQVFALAGIAYGRIDYAMLEGRGQVWEINLNPTIGRGPQAKVRPMTPEVEAVWRRARELQHERLRQAFAALDVPVGQGSITPRLDAGLWSRIRRAERRERGRRALFSWLGSGYRGARQVAPVRAVLDRLLPR
jgi:hypothetical protein